jgi:flagellar basal body-associated protein FliL
LGDVVVAVEKKTRKRKAKKTLESKDKAVIDSRKITAKVDLGFIGSKDEVAEARNVASRARVRSEIENDIESFLKQGGKIENVAPNVMGDPPRKPESNYGSRPI